MRAFYQAMEEDESQLEELLSMLAIATVCDVVDLTGENRIFVKEGLRRIKDTQNIGLKALLNVHDLMDKQIQSYALGFIVGPCINASGRLESAEKALNLFLEEDEEKAKQTAEELKELNDLRKTMTENGVKEALGQAFEYEAKGDKVLVLYLPECHESIAGIIAGRIKDRLNHPAFVLTDAKEGIKGSGRSIEGYSMFEEMMKVKEVFTKFGGHPMAAGCSLKKEKLQEFRKKIKENKPWPFLRKPSMPTPSSPATSMSSPPASTSRRSFPARCARPRTVAASTCSWNSTSSKAHSPVASSLIV
jgi:single-stranded-DNA-specific exonuclease